MHTERVRGICAACLSKAVSRRQRFSFVRVATTTVPGLSRPTFCVLRTLLQSSSERRDAIGKHRYQGDNGRDTRCHVDCLWCTVVSNDDTGIVFGALVCLRFCELQSTFVKVASEDSRHYSIIAPIVFVRVYVFVCLSVRALYSGMCLKCVFLMPILVGR